MTEFGSSPVPLGHANSGEAFVLGDGLGALHYLQRIDLFKRTQQARQQAAARQQQEAHDKYVVNRAVLRPAEGGVHFTPMLEQATNDTYNRMQAIAIDKTKSWQQRALEIEREKTKRDELYAASRTADKYVTDQLQTYHNDSRYNAAATSKLLTDSLYQRNEDGSLKVETNGRPQVYSPLDWDPRTATAAVSKGNDHLVGSEVYGQFIDHMPESSVTYSREALPGGQGYKNVAKSDIFELTPEGKLRRDPKTNRPVLRDSPETLAAFDSDRLNKQFLDAQLAKHNLLLQQATERGHRGEPLTPEEADAVQLEASPTGARMGLFQRDIVRYGYGREEVAQLQKAAHVGRAAAGHALKYNRVGGTDYAPELVGGTAAGGTQGLLALASGDPLGKVQADGKVVPHTARNTHRQYVLLRNGQPGQLVTNNAEPQNLAYSKPQLYLTSPTGNVVTPTDPSLLQRYQAGDRQPLLNWVRNQREAHPGYAVKWHFQATPADGKLGGQAGADQIYQRLVADRRTAHLTPGQSGYKSDDELAAQAQKLAREQGGTLLIPYSGDSKKAIDLATGYHLRDKEREHRMQQQREYFDSQTAPRPASQRPAPKKLGINFGAAPTPAAAPTAPAPAAPTFKRAGTKKTGINFSD